MKKFLVLGMLLGASVAMADDAVDFDTFVGSCDPDGYIGNQQAEPTNIWVTCDQTATTWEKGTGTSVPISEVKSITASLTSSKFPVDKKTFEQTTARYDSTDCWIQIKKTYASRPIKTSCAELKKYKRDAKAGEGLGAFCVAKLSALTPLSREWTKATAGQCAKDQVVGSQDPTQSK